MIFVGLVCNAITSCLSTKDITYFQPFDESMDEVSTRIRPPYSPTIKVGDVLSITVSSFDKDDREIFNPIPDVSTRSTQSGGLIVLQPIKGFTVDSLGTITFPQIGKLKVSGLTTKEVELLLTDQLQESVLSPTVFVFIANYIISILGEVSRPAQYVITQNRITLPEALALAGDLTIYGNRKNVNIIRDRGGQRIFAQIDLTDRMVFVSPYYYLQPGDLIYVEPAKGRITSTDRVYQMTPMVISSITLCLLIINSIK